jgi:hypothetical protein
LGLSLRQGLGASERAVGLELLVEPLFEARMSGVLLPTQSIMLSKSLAIPAVAMYATASAAAISGSLALSGSLTISGWSHISP